MIVSPIKRFVTALFAVALITALPIDGQSQSDATGKVAGAVYDARSGDVIKKAGIELVGAGQTLYTGVDGDFTVDLKPGAHTLRFFLEGYSEQTAEVTVVAGETIEQNVVLVPVGYGESIDVIAGASSSDVIAALEERKAATSIGEFVSRAEISKNPASTTAGIVQSVVGVSIGTGNIVTVRGLGDRYSTQMLNDAAIPTPDPERRVVPMDLIPSSLLQSVRVLKTFTPDQPGEFAGGLLRLETIEMPSKSSLSVSTSFGFNSQTHGEDFLAGPRFGSDWLGYGVGDRGLPSIIPTGSRLLRGDRFTAGFTAEELQTFGRSFSNVFTPSVDDARPDLNAGVSGGHSFGKFGIVGGFALRNISRTVPDEERNVYATDASLEPRLITSFNFDTSTRVSRLGGSLNLTYEINSNNKLFLKNFYSNQATDEARQYNGLSGEIGVPLQNYRLRYTAEQIYSGQLSGRHDIPLLWNAILNWRYSYARSTLDDPALSEITYQFDPSRDAFIFLPVSQSLSRLYNEMTENIREPAFDLSKFWFFSKVTVNGKAGASYQNRDRVFDSRRFRYVPRFRTAFDFSQTAEQLLAPENINPDGFEILETTRGTDHYDALHNITAFYGMADVVAGRWRFVGGARVEKSIQRVTTFDPFAPELRIIEAALDDTDTLPVISVAYSLTPTMTVRGGYTSTVVRPQFRELSPYEFTDVFAGYTTFGNPNLLRTLLRNYDTRYEWYLSPGELFAASYFYKKLENPIESVIGRGQFVRTFTNAESAVNQGFELEFRKNMAFLGEKFSGLSATTNYTFVDSNVTIAEADAGDLTSTDRALVGQARHLFNAGLLHRIERFDFETRAYFNYTGAHIVDVGATGLPDIIEKGRPRLDLAFSKQFGGEAKRWSIDVELENLLNRKVDTRIGDRIFRSFRSGRDVSFKLSYSFF